MSNELNNKEATIEGIKAIGYVEQTGRSKKYRCFDRQVPEGVPTCTYLVGKSGALRYIGPNGSAIADSVSRTNTKSHAALRYVGRIAQVCQLTAEEFNDIRVAVLRGEIPVSKDGYYNE